MKERRLLKLRIAWVTITNYLSLASDSSDTIFDKVISKQIKVDIIFEDNKVLAFHDVKFFTNIQISPQAPVHFLVIPKAKGRLSKLEGATEEDTDILGHLLYTSSKIAKGLGLNKGGYRVVINNGVHGCQSVHHLHVHVIGGKQLNWPPG